MTTSSTLDLRLPQYPRTGNPALDLALVPVFNAIRLLQQSGQGTADATSVILAEFATLQSVVTGLSTSLEALIASMQSLSGAEIFSSLANPANSQGKDGDLWIVANTAVWFKVAGIWGVVLTASAPVTPTEPLYLEPLQLSGFNENINYIDPEGSKAPDFVTLTTGEILYTRVTYGSA